MRRWPLTLFAVLAGPALAVYNQSVNVTGDDAPALAQATISFTSDSGETSEVAAQPDENGDGVDLAFAVPGDNAEAGTLMIRSADGRQQQFVVPAPTPGHVVNLDLDLGFAMREMTLEAMACLSPHVKFSDPAPVEGPVIPYKSGTVLSPEENRALAEYERTHRAELDAALDQAIEEQSAREQELLASTRAERAAADAKVEAYYRAHGIDGLSYYSVYGRIGEDGLYESIDLVYETKRGTDHYVARFDGQGNLISPPTQTPLGKAETNVRAHKPAHSGVTTWYTTRDNNGNEFPYKVVYDNGGGYLLFNERGIAYLGDFFDAEGGRRGAFYEPRELPRYGDLAGTLTAVDYQQVASTACSACESSVADYNAIAEEMNLIAREMNHVAAQHRGVHDYAIAKESYSQSLPLLRGRYEHLLGVWQGLSERLDDTRQTLLDCAKACMDTDRACPANTGDVADDGLNLYVPPALEAVNNACPNCAEHAADLARVVGQANGLRVQMKALSMGTGVSDGDILNAHLDLIAQFGELEAQANQLRIKLNECEQQQCAAPEDEGLVADSPTIAADPFLNVDTGLYIPCEGMSAFFPESMTCSASVDERPEQCGGFPSASNGWQVTRCGSAPDVLGGGWNVEFSVDDPASIGLEGCEALSADLLDQYLGAGFADARVVRVACNEYAEGHVGKTPVVRGHRDQLNVNLDRRRAADYKRRQDRSYSDSLGEAVQSGAIEAFNDGERVTCPTPAKDEAVTFSDPDFSKFPAEGRKLAENVSRTVTGEHTGDQIAAAIGTVDNVTGVFKATGMNIASLEQGNATAQLVVQVADGLYNLQAGEGLSLEEVRGVLDNVATATGQEFVDTFNKRLGVLGKLDVIRHKQQNGIPISKEDVKELTDALNEFRGERFEGLGELLDGVSAGIDQIDQLEDLVTKLEEIKGFLDLAGEGIDDPVKAFEAFAQYLGLLGAIAEIVPGMGDFVAQYAEAVASMQGNIETIANAVAARNEAIRQAAEAIDGYDYEKLKRDLQEFEDDFATEAPSGQTRTADAKNLDKFTEDASEALRQAERDWRYLIDCVKRNGDRLVSMQARMQTLLDSLEGLPSQEELKEELQRLNFLAVFKDYVKANPDWRPDASQVARTGLPSAAAVKERIKQLSDFKMKEAIRVARERFNRRATVDMHARGMEDDVVDAKRQIDDCGKDLMAAKQQYLQAYRDFVAVDTYWRAFINNEKNLEKAAEARRDALAAIDAQIASQGFRVRGRVVEVVIVDDCDERRTGAVIGR